MKYKLDIYKTIDNTDDWPMIDTIYGETEQDCIDKANREYSSDEYHFTWPVEAS